MRMTSVSNVFQPKRCTKLQQETDQQMRIPNVTFCIYDDLVHVLQIQTTALFFETEYYPKLEVFPEMCIV